MSERAKLILEAALVAAIFFGFLAVWAHHAGACTPDHDRGKVCADEIPAVYARVCADGCFVVHPDDLETLENYRELVPKLRGLAADLRLEVTTLQRQRDESATAAQLLDGQLSEISGQLIETRGNLAAAPRWSTVVVSGVVGAGFGAVLTLVALVIM